MTIKIFVTILVPFVIAMSFIMYFIINSIICDMRIEHASKTYDSGGKEILIKYVKEGNFMVYDVALNKLELQADKDVSIDISNIMVDIKGYKLEELLYSIEHFNDKRTIPMLVKKHKEYENSNDVDDINMALLIDQIILPIQGLNVELAKNMIHSYSVPRCGFLEIIFKDGSIKCFIDDQEITKQEYEKRLEDGLSPCEEQTEEENVT